MGSRHAWQGNKQIILRSVLVRNAATSNVVAYLTVAGFLAWGIGGFILFNWGMNLAASFGLNSPLFALPVVGWFYLVWIVWTTTGVLFSAFAMTFIGWIALTLVLGAALQRR